MSKFKHLFRDTVIVLLITAVIMISAEFCFRLASSYRVSSRQASSDQAAMKNRIEAFDGKYTTDQLKEIRDEADDRLEYLPWVQFGNYDHSLKYSRAASGLRESYQDPNCGNKERKVTVWFFGGSTMYGIGVPWWDTIPSQFVKQTESDAVCYEAVNYGVPYFYSRQELVRFLAELLDGRRPDIAVFLDGLNDFAQPGSAIRGEPFFTPVLRQAIPKGKSIVPPTPAAKPSSTLSTLVGKSHLATYLSSKFKSQDASSVGRGTFRNNYDIPPGIPSSPGEVASYIVKNYLSVREQLAVSCDGYHVLCMQYLQPVAVKDYSPSSDEVLTKSFREGDKSRVKRFLVGYDLLSVSLGKTDQGLISGKPWWRDISGLFADYQGIPYVDDGHYSPRAISIIAAVMRQDLTKLLKHEK